jgi:tripartite-type tricarboxylate transporter receptor subunit TctC
LDHGTAFLHPQEHRPEIIKKLNQQIVQASKLPEVTQRINNLGAIVVANTAEDFAKQIAQETQTWSGVVKKLGIKLD